MGLCSSSQKKGKPLYGGLTVAEISSLGTVCNEVYAPPAAVATGTSLYDFTGDPGLGYRLFIQGTGATVVCRGTQSVRDALVDAYAVPVAGGTQGLRFHAGFFNRAQVTGFNEHITSSCPHEFGSGDFSKSGIHH